MSRERYAVVGAGRTGRGFIGRLLAENGAEIVFIEKNRELADALNAAGSFRVRFFGGVRDDLTVGNFRAVGWEDADLTGVKLVFVSVGGQNLAEAGRSLAQKLPGSGDCRVIACENAPHPAEVLRRAVGRPEVRISEAAVFCTTTQDGGCNIASEDYPSLPCDAALLGEGAPSLRGLQPVNDFGGLLMRKLFTYNAASCVIAYLGALRGYTVYGDAANDPEILRKLDHNYEETNRAICTVCGYPKEEQERFALMSRRKFTNRAIVDTVARNAREPQRKLGPNERIIGPMRLIERCGGDVSVLAETAAAMLLYDAPGEDEWRRIRAENDFPQILRKFCGLDPDEKHARKILSCAAALRH